MKITSGKYKYRNIEVPRGIRPTTEKVREAVFSMIMQWLPDAEVLDLFAGSGAMGLEALSRGAAKCTFVETNRQNQRVLTSNIKNCGAEQEAVVLGRDFESALTEIAGKKEKPVFDIVILDPPYEKTDYYVTAMMKLQESGLIDERSIVVCEHLYDNKLSDICGNLEKFKEKKYGSIGVDLYMVDNR
ncbi:MAG: 16S rRNA (guanine(966)-N(2))-methyltransferase RsmD [Mogibacterium sp.]|nr:16S rRNA (guanine(966)-N(2))-methyltransferase RsmD [Mogibacterium sp.]